MKENEIELNKQDTENKRKFPFSLVENLLMMLSTFKMS